MDALNAIDGVFAERVHGGILHVGNSRSGSGLNRYGFISEQGGAPAELSEAERVVGRLLCEKSDKGLSISFDVHPDEDWIGFGDQTRERMFQRGRKADCMVANVKSYISVPFFISTRGYAILVNSTHRVEFDICAETPSTLSWLDHGGRIDFYLMEGGSFLENIKLYTLLTGKPKLPPEWAFGLWYICRMQANDYEAVNDAVNFRREEIPCDVIGLEPGWMDKHYNLSTEKTWHPDRFPIPSWCPNGPHNFIDAIKRMGFHFELWECNEYDLSYEEERRLGRAGGAATAASSAAFKDGAEIDAHFSCPRYADTLTKKDEPWFEHHKKFVDQGVDFFKQDGAYQVCSHPDRLWGNGMTDAEMHNLYPLLYARQMWEGLKEFKGLRPVIFTPAGWTGFQAFAGTWTGDTGGRLETLGAMLNTAVMAHNWVTNDMEVMQPDGIHFGYLQPWSQINSWTYFRMPWAQGKRLCDMHRRYAQLRSRLIPYIYSWAFQTCKAGAPLLLRPLQIEFEGEKACRDIMHEYMLGRDLLVTAYKKDVYLPEGSWKDFWTGKVYAGGQRLEIGWPEEYGGGLFVREGAIIPLGPIMQFRKERSLDSIELYLTPSAKGSSFSLYEDDGISFEHLKGAFAETKIETEMNGDDFVIRIASPEGAFADIPKNRKWSLKVALERPPADIVKDGTKLPKEKALWDEIRKELSIKDIGSGEIRLLANAAAKREK